MAQVPTEGTGAGTGAGAPGIGATGGADKTPPVNGLVPAGPVSGAGAGIAAAVGGAPGAGVPPGGDGGTGG